MRVFALLPVLAAVAGSSAALVGSSGPIECAKETVVHESYIGKDANVKLQFSHCEGAPHVDAAGDVLAARAADADPVIDVCDATCACLPASSILSELPLARASRGDVRCAHVREG